MMLSGSSQINKPYKVEHIRDSEQQWVVVELPTAQTIATYKNSRPAKIRANVLNGGVGFRGWTPGYILESIR